MIDGDRLSAKKVLPAGPGVGAQAARLAPAAAHDRPGVRAFEARAHRSLEAVEPVWRRFERDGACMAYQTYDWASRVVAHLVLPAKALPVVIEVTEADTGASVALLPLVLRRRRGGRTIDWLDCGVCDYAAPLLAPGFAPSAAEAEALWAAACRALPPADFLRVERIPAMIGATVNPLGLLAAARPIDTKSFGLPIEGSPETLLKRVCKPSMAKELGKDARRLDRHGEVRFVLASSEAEVRTIFAALLDQRRTRFGEVGRFDLLADPNVQSFYLDAALAGVRGEGPARLFGVSVDGLWIACQYALLGPDIMHALLLTMAGDEWKKFSPGMYVVAKVMVWAREQGLAYFDLTIGDLPYKSGFGAKEQRLSELRRPLSLRGSLLLSAVAGLEAARAAARRNPRLYNTLRGMMQSLRRLRNRAVGAPHVTTKSNESRPGT